MNEYKVNTEFIAWVELSYTMRASGEFNKFSDELTQI
jgi:hypothetical protein